MESATERGNLEARRGAAMRALFPMLYSWRAGASAAAVPARVYAQLAQARTLDELEQRLRQPLPRFPTELIEAVRLRDGRSVLVRPVVPADAPLQRAFVHALSAASRQRRFHSGVAELPEPVVRYLTEVDYVDHLALLAEAVVDGAARQVAEARWVRRADEGDCADFAIAVADQHQGQGLGGRLLDLLERSARARGVRCLHGSVLRSNTPMIRWLATRGWRIELDPLDASALAVELALQADAEVWSEAA